MSIKWKLTTKAYQAVYELKTGNEPTQLIEIRLRREPDDSEGPLPFSPVQSSLIRSTADRLFAAETDALEKIKVPDSLNQLLRDEPVAVRKLVWGVVLGLSGFTNAQVGL